MFSAHFHKDTVLTLKKRSYTYSYQQGIQICIGFQKHNIPQTSWISHSTKLQTITHLWVTHEYSMKSWEPSGPFKVMTFSSSWRNEGYFTRPRSHNQPWTVVSPRSSCIRVGIFPPNLRGVPLRRVLIKSVLEAAVEQINPLSGPVPADLHNWPRRNVWLGSEGETHSSALQELALTSKADFSNSRHWHSAPH